MTPRPLSFKPDASIVDVVERTRDERYQNYPVVDDRGRLIGLLTGDAVARSVRVQEFAVTVGDLMQPPLIAARADEAVRDLLDRMESTTVDRCVVVDDEGVVVGFISPSDLVRARFREASAMSDETLR